MLEFSREKTEPTNRCIYLYTCMYVCLYVSVYLFLCCKELACDFGGWQVLRLVVGKLETQESCWCSSVWKAIALRPKKAVTSVCLQSQGKPDIPAPGSQTGGLPSYHRKVILFALFRPSTDWVWPTHIRAGNLLYSVDDSNVSSIQKQFLQIHPE